MKLTIIDFETTGVNPEECGPIELGWATFEMPSNTLLECGSRLVKARQHLPKEVQELTGITLDMIQEYGISEEKLSLILKVLAEGSDMLGAHNAFAFDSVIWNRFFPSAHTPWLDTRVHLPFPPSVKTRQLTHLAAEFGGFVNPFPHRALPDVFTTQRLLSMFPWDEVKKLVESPLKEVTFRFKWGCPNFNAIKDFVKESGAYFDGDKKHWVLTTLECYWPDIEAGLRKVDPSQSVATIFRRLR